MYNPFSTKNHPENYPKLPGLFTLFSGRNITLPDFNPNISGKTTDVSHHYTKHRYSSTKISHLSTNDSWSSTEALHLYTEVP